jgi:hypothetical protein
MRLHTVERGHRLREKLILGAMRLVGRGRLDDVLRTLYYRPEFFGRPFSDCVQEAMRGESEWAVGERELMAAFVSHQNQCVF